jgi:hypothetical protein
MGSDRDLSLWCYTIHAKKYFKNNKIYIAFISKYCHYFCLLSSLKRGVFFVNVTVL